MPAGRPTISDRIAANVIAEAKEHFDKMRRDTMVYGHGGIIIGNDGSLKHVPIADMLRKSRA